MLSIYVIPFFLAVHLPTPRYVDNSSTEYTFQIRLRTTTFLEGQRSDGLPYSLRNSSSLRSSRSGSTRTKYELTIGLKCRTYQKNALLCHKDDHEQRPRKARTLVNLDDLKDIRRTLFQIRFNRNGPTSYAVEEGNQGTTEFLLNLFRSFGNQLNVGAQTKFDEESVFQSTEQSVIGLCPTLFEIKHRPHIKDTSHVLEEGASLSLPYYDFEEGKMLNIAKKRKVEGCYESVVYMFGNTYWSGLLPENIEMDLDSSQSIMTLSKYSFESRTRNIFNLYSRHSKVGHVMEDIEVVLKSVLHAKEYATRIFLHPFVTGVTAGERKK